MAQRATSLGPKPSLFYFFFSFCVFWGFVFLFFCFRVFAFAIKSPVFPPKRGMVCVFFCVSLCFSLALFELAPFSLLVFSLSLSLYLSRVLFLLPSFLFSFLYRLLAFLFVFFASLFQDVILFLFSLFLSCLFSIIKLDLFLLCILFSCCCCFLFFLLCYFVMFDFWKPVKNISENGNWKNNKNEKCWKKGHFDKRS